MNRLIYCEMQALLRAAADYPITDPNNMDAHNIQNLVNQAFGTIGVRKSCPFCEADKWVQRERSDQHEEDTKHGKLYWSSLIWVCESCHGEYADGPQSTFNLEQRQRAVLALEDKGNQQPCSKCDSGIAYRAPITEQVNTKWGPVICRSTCWSCRACGYTVLDESQLKEMDRSADEARSAAKEKYLGQGSSEKKSKQMLAFEKTWEATYPDNPDGSKQFEQDENGVYIRIEVRTGFAMFCAGLENEGGREV